MYVKKILIYFTIYSIKRTEVYVLTKKILIYSIKQSEVYIFKKKYIK